MTHHIAWAVEATLGKSHLSQKEKVEVAIRKTCGMQGPYISAM
jgi:hypothetical protein